MSFVGRNWASAYEEKIFSVPIGPVVISRAYFATRHPLQISGQINPFDSLADKFWINYFILYVLLVLGSIGIHLHTFKHIYVKQIIGTIISPADSTWSPVIKSQIMLQCLISFTFWTFDILYGVDLWAILVGKVETKSSKGGSEVWVFWASVVIFWIAILYTFTKYSEIS